jgi:hypothetical protein
MGMLEESAVPNPSKRDTLGLSLSVTAVNSPCCRWICVQFYYSLLLLPPLSQQSAYRWCCWCLQLCTLQFSRQSLTPWSFLRHNSWKQINEQHQKRNRKMDTMAWTLRLRWVTAAGETKWAWACKFLLEVISCRLFLIFRNLDAVWQCLHSDGIHIRVLLSRLLEGIKCGWQSQHWADLVQS